VSDNLAALLELARIVPPEDRRDALLAGMMDLRQQADIVRLLAEGEPATVFRLDPLG
jgi:hypothetical protein